MTDLQGDGVVVKPLDWRKPTKRDLEEGGRDCAIWIAPGFGGEYAIQADGQNFILWRVTDPYVFDTFPTVEAAKAHAEADWQKTICRKLAAPPASAPDPRVEARPDLAGVVEWRPASAVPQVKAGREEYRIVAVRRAHDGKVYRFPATYLNQCELRFEDDNEPRAVTGWFSAVTGEDGEGETYHELLGAGDVLVAWCDLPDAPSAAILAEIGPAA